MKTPEELAALREEGLLHYRQAGDDKEERALGLSQLVEASNGGDLVAKAFVGEQMLRGYLKPKTGDREEHALKLLRLAAAGGEPTASMVLAKHFMKRYMVDVDSQIEKPADGPLTGFDGKRLKINRKGFFVPVDAVLTYSKEEGNVLQISANISFVNMDDDEIADEEAYEKAVLAGFRCWQGTYRVFGGQKLTVKMHLTSEPRFTDSVLVYSVTDAFRETVLAQIRNSPARKRADKAQELISDGRSFMTAFPVKPWSVHSPKMMYIQSKSKRFDDYEELKHIAKHEFGHVLGIGDLYASEADGLKGVKKGTYKELDSYYVSDAIYHQVMCDHHAPVGNNDIEMVVLAYSENAYQRFQPDQTGKKISKALGKGN